MENFNENENVDVKKDNISKDIQNQPEETLISSEEILKDEIMQKNTKKKFPIWIIIAGICAVVIIALFSLITSGQPVEPKYDSGGIPVFVPDEEIEFIFADSRKYLGEFVALTCKISSIETMDGFIAIEAYADIENEENPIIIIYPFDAPPDVEVGNYIRATGYIYGHIDYTNIHGEDVSSQSIIAAEVFEVFPMDTASPILKTIDVDKEITQNAHKVKVDKVEFTENQTRVYITATNDTNDIVSLFTSTSVIIQGTREYESLLIYDYDSSELQLELTKGSSVSGTLFYPGINTETDFSFVIEVFYENYDDVDIDEYTFDIKVK